MLVRSDAISFLTSAGREAMCAYGVTTVIDMRTEAERNGTFDPRFPRNAGDMTMAPGVTYLHRPLIDDPTLRRVSQVPGVLEGYVMMVDNRREALGRIFTAIADAEGGVVFHCFAGKDRTGLVAAMLLTLAGVAPEHVAADFGETDVQLAGEYAKWIAAAAPELHAGMRENLCCPPERILAVLAHVENRWGGVEAYLEACGVTPQNVDQLRSRLA